MKLGEVMGNIECEAVHAMMTNPPFHSYHEAYAVILEEVDELWDEVKKRINERSHDKIRDEAVQIAAMCIRLLVELVPKEK